MECPNCKKEPKSLFVHFIAFDFNRKKFVMNCPNCTRRIYFELEIKSIESEKEIPNETGMGE